MVLRRHGSVSQGCKHFRLSNACEQDDLIRIDFHCCQLKQRTCGNRRNSLVSTVPFSMPFKRGEVINGCTSNRFVQNPRISLGLDIAPVLLPPMRLANNISQRMRTVQANFLDRWPFEDNSFDFVRLAFLGMGVPEQAWGQLFEEATRVLKPKDGWVQCIDVLIPTGSRRYTIEGGAAGKSRSAIGSARASIDLAQGLKSPVTPTSHLGPDTAGTARSASSLSNHSESVQQTKLSQLLRASTSSMSCLYSGQQALASVSYGNTPS